MEVVFVIFQAKEKFSGKTGSIETIPQKPSTLYKKPHPDRSQEKKNFVMLALCKIWSKKMQNKLSTALARAYKLLFVLFLETRTYFF